MARDDPAFTVAEMEARVVRYAELRPCFNAFIDSRSPGSSAKENFTIIGPGVSENPAQHVHIPESHGFNIGGARQPPNCVNSQHSHTSAEVFVAHSGRWRFDLGEHGEAAQVYLEPGDTISLPVNMFRGFINVSDDSGFLWAVLGGDDPGRVTWAPYVFDMAKDYGLVLLENGRLIDMHAGERVPDGVAAMPPTTAEQAAALATPTQAQAERLVVHPEPGTPHQGIVRAPVISPDAPLAWPHGFTIERLDILDSAVLGEWGARAPTVVFVHAGHLRFEWDGGALALGPGDTMTVPPGVEHRWVGEGTARAFRVVGARA